VEEVVEQAVEHVEEREIKEVPIRGQQLRTPTLGMRD
jgi:hypothetical protein